MNWKKNWEDKLWKEFQDCSWDEIQQLLKDAYAYTKNDVEYKNEYTHLIIFNLKMLAEYGVDKISFKQWKSFRAYVSSYKKQSIDMEKIFGKTEPIDILMQSGRKKVDFGV